MQITIAGRALALALLVVSTPPVALAEVPVVIETVNFRSADAKTTLVGYVFRADEQATPRPAVVMMHGRAGAYSSLAHGAYNVDTLSKRHKFWGELLASKGYVAVLVDGFGPRGYPKGFPAHSYETRPAELDEVEIRPLDAYGALAYLRTRPDVETSRVVLLGWSNGGSATLAAMSADAPGIAQPTPDSGFRGGVVLYPACTLKGKFDDGYRPYAPVRVFMGSADEEVSPRRCSDLVQRSASVGSDVDIVLYPGATHGFDDPSRKRSRVDANADATDDAVPKVLRFLAARLR
jgi:dienelactone hydrolase